MIIKHIFVLVLFMQAFASRAQLSAGVGIGYSYNHLHANVSNREYTRNANASGYSADLRVDYGLTNWLSVRTGFGIVQKNYSFMRTEHYAGIYQRFTNSYLQSPLMGQIKVFRRNRFNVRANIGVYSAYWLSAKVSGVTPNIFNSTTIIESDGQIVDYLSLTSYSDSYEFNKVRDNRFEFGFAFGAEISYKPNDKYFVFLESNYYQSLTDQQQKYMINQSSRMNRTFCVSVGCSMKIPSERKTLPRI